MSKFSNLLEDTFKRSNLRRVRLKVDPAFCKEGEISKFQGYEGFILSEDGVSAKMYIECMDGSTVIATVPCNMIDVENSLTKMEKLKLNVLVFLKEEKGMKYDSPLVQMVMNSSTVEMLEAFLLNNGCTEKDLLDIYRMEYL
jgi:hypothetical protein